VPRSTWGQNRRILYKVGISCEGSQTAAICVAKVVIKLLKFAIFANIYRTRYIYYDLVGNINFMESWRGEVLNCLQEQ